MLCIVLQFATFWPNTLFCRDLFIASSVVAVNHSVRVITLLVIRWHTPEKDLTNAQRKDAMQDSPQTPTWRSTFHVFTDKRQNNTYVHMKDVAKHSRKITSWRLTSVRTPSSCRTNVRMKVAKDAFHSLVNWSGMRKCTRVIRVRPRAARLWQRPGQRWQNTRKFIRSGYSVTSVRKRFGTSGSCGNISKFTLESVWCSTVPDKDARARTRPPLTSKVTFCHFTKSSGRSSAPTLTVANPFQWSKVYCAILWFMILKRRNGKSPTQNALWRPV